MSIALACDLFKGRGTLRLEEREDPPPGYGEIAVRIEACGANASDWEAVTGRPAYSRVLAPFGGRGRILGSDVCGTVESLGRGVVEPVKGQRVLADTFGQFGGFAERVVAKADLFVPVPDGIDPVVAAALPQSGTIALAGMRDRVSAGQSVLINGAGGGSGPLAVQLAVAAGARVTAVDRAAKRTALDPLGIAEFIDFEREDFARQDRAHDLILDLFGTRPPRKVQRVLAPGGRYYLVGGTVPALLSVLVGGTLRGVVSNRKLSVLAVPQGPGRLTEILNLVADGTLAPVIGARVGLADAAKALSMMGAGGIAGKLVILP